jgi:hypothetical protein
MQIRKLILSLFVLGALAWSQVAHAVTITYTGLTHGTNATISINGTNHTTYVGEIAFRFTGGTPYGMPNTFFGYCIELEEYLLGSSTAEIRSTNALTRLGNSPASGPSAAWLYNTYGPTVNDNIRGAALQIAIWKSLYDTADYSLSTGYFRVISADAAVLSTANSFLSALRTTGGTSEATWFHVPTSGLYGQDVIGPRSSAIPEPGIASMLIGASMSSILLCKRRIRQRR